MLALGVDNRLVTPYVAVARLGLVFSDRLSSLNVEQLVWVYEAFRSLDWLNLQHQLTPR